MCNRQFDFNKKITPKLSTFNIIFEFNSHQWPFFVPSESSNNGSPSVSTEKSTSQPSTVTEPLDPEEAKRRVGIFSYLTY